MSAIEILKLIETVSPDDTAKLDEIESRIWCLLNGYEYSEALRDHTLYKACNRGDIAKYASSRDALKAIRPTDCYLYQVNNAPWNKGYEFLFRMGLGLQEYQVVGKILPDEQLAELHAIIQAIEHEHTK